MANYALTFLKTVHQDGDTLISVATEAFGKDFATFARANDDKPLVLALLELKVTPRQVEAIKSGTGKITRDVAYAMACKAGRDMSGITTGYVGAKTGKFDVQSEDVKSTFNSAIERFKEEFRRSLTDSGAFDAPIAKTKEEKEKAKTEKAEKAEKAVNDLITAKIQAGELVRASDIKKLEDFGQLALIGALKIQGVDVEALKAEHEALKAEHEALKAEHEALKASKSSKTKKPANV